MHIRNEPTNPECGIDYFGPYNLEFSKTKNVPVRVFTESGDDIARIGVGQARLLDALQVHTTTRFAVEEFNHLGPFSSSNGEASTVQVLSSLEKYFTHRLEVYGGRYSKSVLWKNNPELIPIDQPYSKLAIDLGDLVVCELNRRENQYEAIQRQKGKVLAQFNALTFEVLGIISQNAGRIVHWSDIDSLNNNKDKTSARALFRNTYKPLKSIYGDGLTILRGGFGISLPNNQDNQSHLNTVIIELDNFSGLSLSRYKKDKWTLSMQGSSAREINSTMAMLLMRTSKDGSVFVSNQMLDALNYSHRKYARLEVKRTIEKLNNRLCANDEIIFNLEIEKPQKQSILLNAPKPMQPNTVVPVETEDIDRVLSLIQDIEQDPDMQDMAYKVQKIIKNSQTILSVDDLFATLTFDNRWKPKSLNELRDDIDKIVLAFKNGELSNEIVDSLPPYVKKRIQPYDKYRRNDN